MTSLTNVVPTMNAAVVKSEGGRDTRQVVSVGGNNTPPAMDIVPSVGGVSGAVAMEAAGEVTQHMKMAGTSLSITVDDRLGATIIKVTDKETDELIRQIPPEEIVSLARFLRENAGVGGFELADTMKGLLLDSDG